MPQAAIELLQFPFSHFNEKVRWALDFKGIAHQRINYLPGPHVPQIRRLTGQNAVPVLRIDGKVIFGSARIIDELEQRYPTPPLYPQDRALRDEALTLQARFDKELGPATRRLIFDATLGEPAYVADMFSTGHPQWKRTLYRIASPLTAIVIRKGNGVDPERVRKAEDLVASTLDFLAERSTATGYLVGDTFSIADLAAVALLGPITDVPHPDMKKPRPMPARAEELLARYAGHPAVSWALEVYRRHRP